MRRNSQPIVSAPHRRRRHLWVRAVRGLVSTAVIATAVSVQADPSGDALARLKWGNARFVADATEALPITAPRRAALAQGQSPFATVLSCADSRVPPEVVFHTGLGDLFVVRSAAHVTDRAVLATLEYGADRLHTPLLVVMGHENCGIVKAALDTRETKATTPNLDYLLNAIRPAAARSSSQPPDTRLRAAILANVEETINQLLDTSPTIKRLAETQQLLLVGAYYELASGRVHFSEPVHVLTRPASAAPAGRTSASPAARVPVSARPPSATTSSAAADKAAVAAPPTSTSSVSGSSPSTTVAKPSPAARVPPPATH